MGALATLVYKWLFCHVYKEEVDCRGSLWYPLFNGVMGGLLSGMLAVVGQIGFSCGRGSTQMKLVSVLPFVILYCWHYMLSRFTHLSSNMPYQDAVEVDEARTSALESSNVQEKFGASYYRD